MLNIIHDGYFDSIVAIHGLDGDRKESWTTENGTFWLRDFLPGDLPNARILTYGYDSATRGRMQLSNQTLYDHAEDLVNKLVIQRKITQTEVRPDHYPLEDCPYTPR